MHRLSALLVLALVPGWIGCATGDGSGGVDAGELIRGDAGDPPDAPPAVDAAPPADAASPAADAAVADALAIADATVDAPPDAAPVDAAVPDAMPDAAPDACVPDWIGLLGNGDFEQGGTAWNQTGGTIIRQYGAGYPWPAHSGTWAALFGGINNADHLLTQSVTVPANATALRLRGAMCFVTEETTTLVEFDTLTVQIQGAVTEEYVFSNLDAGETCTWTLFQLDAPTSHAGETVTLSLHGQTDGLEITSFGLDTLVLEALACP